MAVIIGVATVTAALISVDNHTPMAVCSNSPNIRHQIMVFSVTHKHTESARSIFEYALFTEITTVLL